MKLSSENLRPIFSPSKHSTMSHSLLFQAADTASSRSANNTLSMLPLSRRYPYHMLSKPAVSFVKLRRRNLAVRAHSAPTERENDSVSRLERCFAVPAAPGTLDSLPSPSGPVMKGQYGALGAVTLEKSKLDMSQKQTHSSPELDIGGGSGGIGKHINHGGGDGGDDGDDGDDDDDYFDDFDDGDGGDEGGLFRRKILLEELFDRKFVDAVLNEWQKTMMDLPAGFRQAYEMETAQDRQEDSGSKSWGSGLAPVGF